MPITATVTELIVREIVDRLQAYAEDGQLVFAKVYREITAAHKTTPTDYQVIVRAMNPVRVPALDRLGNPNAVAYQLTVDCYGQVVISENNTEAAEGHATQIASQIVKAVTTGASWYTMDGNAINSSVGDVTVSGTEAIYTGLVQFQVTYRVAENDPFTPAG